MSQHHATSTVRRTYATAYRWTDRELFYAFMCGAVIALMLVILLGVAVAVVVP